jgi:hypothetical protein
MSTTVTALPLPVIPPEVSAFAAEAGVRDYLLPVVEMTRRLFPMAPLSVFVEVDPEIPNERYIVLEVDVTGWREEPLFAARQGWTSDLFVHCPATHVHSFRLGMVASS